MSYIPSAVNPNYSVLMTRETFENIYELKYPRDIKKILRLNLTEKNVWYASCDPQVLIEAGNDFKKFWFWAYILPLKTKRLLYWFKFW